MRPPTVYRVLLLLLLCALASADTVVYRNPRAAVVPPCDKGNIKGFDGNKHDYTNNVLKCKPAAATDVVAIVVNGNRYESIACDKKDFWKSGEEKIAKATEEISIQCEKVAPCTVQPTTGTKLDPQTKILTCDDPNNKFAKLIEYGSNRYTAADQIKCDPNTGWSLGTTALPNADAAKVLKMTCQEYCAHSEEGIEKKEDSTGSEPKRVITCKEDFHRLFFASHEVEGNGAICTVTDGWKSMVDGWTTINTQTLKVECIEVCRAVTQTGVIVEDETDKTKKSFKCELPDKGAKKYGVEVNGEYVYSRVKCSHETGWTDENGKELAKAFETLALKCAAVNCLHTSTCENVPDGSDCEPVKVEQMDTLRCGPMHQLYETKLEQYYPGELRCRTVEDDRWHTFEDTNLKGKITIRGRGLNVVCLQKRCNKCAKLATVAEAEFTPGRAGACAANACTLWRVQTAGSSSTKQQYAGSIRCSAEKAKEGRWMTDQKEEVHAAECIDRDLREKEVKCTEAAPVVTNCDKNWTAFGCAQITPLDTGAVECGAKKQIFMKQPGAPFFLDGTKITCHKGTGLWKVERKAHRPEQLRRGGIVICADRNPVPPPSMPKMKAKEGDDKTVRLALILSCSAGTIIFIAAIATVTYKEVRKRRRRGNEY